MEWTFDEARQQLDYTPCNPHGRTGPHEMHAVVSQGVHRARCENCGGLWDYSGRKLTPEQHPTCQSGIDETSEGAWAIRTAVEKFGAMVGHIGEMPEVVYVKDGNDIVRVRIEHSHRTPSGLICVAGSKRYMTRLM